MPFIERMPGGASKLDLLEDKKQVKGLKSYNFLVECQIRDVKNYS